MNPSTGRPAVSIRDVTKSWTPEGRAPVLALDGLDFEVRPGEFVVLLGPSGCGKSTLLYMIAGLEDVSGGEILADGDRRIDMLRAACAAIWGSGLPIYALDVPERLYTSR